MEIYIYNVYTFIFLVRFKIGCNKIWAKCDTQPNDDDKQQTKSRAISASSFIRLGWTELSNNLFMQKNDKS